MLSFSSKKQGCRQASGMQQYAWQYQQQLMIAFALSQGTA